MSTAPIAFNILLLSPLLDRHLLVHLFSILILLAALFITRIAIRLDFVPASGVPLKTVDVGMEGSYWQEGKPTRAVR